MTTAALKSSIHIWSDPNNTTERQQLNAWIKAASCDELEDMMNFYEQYMASNPVAAPFSEHLNQSIEFKIDDWEKTQAMNRSVVSMRFWKAAAAAIVLAGAAWFLLKPAPSAQKEAMVFVEPGSKDLPAGKDRAYLELSDGRRIELDGKHATELNRETAASLDTTNTIIAFPTTLSQTDTTTYQVSTPKGGKFQLLLPDDSKVWLNAESSIRFPKASPFKVMVNDLEVKVLGTHFNVNAFPEEASVTTTLLKGSVQLKANDKTALLKPGFQAILFNNELQVAAANTENAVAWKNGFFAFEKAPVKKIMQQFERWYDVSVQYEGAVPTQYFTGEFSRNFTLAQSLRILAYSGLRFKIEGNKIIVH